MRGELPAHTAQAVLGTSLSDVQLADLVQGGCASVWCFMDGDKAGAKGAKQVALRARGMGLRTRIIQTPAGMDPKDLTKEEILDALRT
ncbi:DNA primase [compost metagenome]